MLNRAVGLVVFLSAANLLAGPEEQLMLDLMMAEPGATVVVPAGDLHFDSPLSLLVSGVTVRGQGPDASRLHFAQQSSGGEALFVQADDVKLVGFSILDPQGDGIKVYKSKNLLIKNVEVHWTRGPHTENGGYGLYPVMTENITIEDCRVTGASDSGIYVGQSVGGIVQRNWAAQNVAGIEIENSRDIVVRNNTATGNTAGILVFNLPDLSQQGRAVQVIDNQVVANNLVNFSDPNNTVAIVPQGTGLMTLAHEQVVWERNIVKDHQTAALILASYQVTTKPYDPNAFDPEVRHVTITNNVFENFGYDPKGGASPESQGIIDIIATQVGVPLPGIVYDGPLTQDWPMICLAPTASVSTVNLDFYRDFAGLKIDDPKFHCRQ